MDSGQVCQIRFVLLLYSVLITKYASLVLGRNIKLLLQISLCGRERSEASLLCTQAAIALEEVLKQVTWKRPGFVLTLIRKENLNPYRPRFYHEDGKELRSPNLIPYIV